MSVLKDKRTTSKAEYVNVANQIYVKTVDFLSRVSPRYSRLIAADTAHLAGQVMDHAAQAAVFPPAGGHWGKDRGAGGGMAERPNRLL